MTAGINALLAALPYGLGKGSDTRGIVVTTVQDYDPASGRVLASVGGDASWLLALAGTYTVGDLIAVLRNPWTVRPELVLGVMPAGSLDTPPPPILGKVPVMRSTSHTDGPVRITRTTATPPDTLEAS